MWRPLPSGMGRKHHPLLGGPRFLCGVLIGIAIRALNGNEIFRVQPLYRFRRRGDSETARFADGDTTDIRADLSPRRDNRFCHISRTKSLYDTFPFAFGAREAVTVHETHLSSLSPCCGDAERNDVLYREVFGG